MTYPISEIEGLPAFAASKLKAHGIRTTDALLEAAYRNPARLAQSMREANEKKKLLRILPSEKSVGDIIAKAKKLPPKITY
jgi:hypothetical protein